MPPLSRLLRISHCFQEVKKRLDAAKFLHGKTKNPHNGLLRGFLFIKQRIVILSVCLQFLGDFHEFIAEFFFIEQGEFCGLEGEDLGKVSFCGMDKSEQF